MTPPATVHGIGPYRLDPARGELSLDGRPVALGGRALELLVMLCEAEGRVVHKDEIIARVWGGTAVEENNIQVQISTLRRALADMPNAIQTIPRQGYRLTVATVPGREAADEPDAALAVAARPVLLPPALGALIGRESDLQEVTALFRTWRLVTIVGAGGMGKTRLALEAARRLGRDYPDGVFLVELAMLADGTAVADAVRSALGLTQSQGGDLIGSGAGALEEKRLLVVLDNCEHLIDAAALAAEWLLRAGRSVHVLATSRERLRAESEAVHRLGGLALPTPGASSAEAGTAPAVQLFIARTQAADPRLVIDDTLRQRIAAICRRLDGMPLALELAAAHVAELGIDGVEFGLNDRLDLLTGGLRTAQPRQQTLRATLDWSYALLAEEERTALRRLCLFPGAFDQAAASVAALGQTDTTWRPSILVSLVARSLVISETVQGRVFYRVLETTREYGLEKLAAAGETELAMATLAAHYLQRLQGESGLPSAATARSIIDNLRAVLDWSFPQVARRPMAIELTARSEGLWLFLSLDRELVERAELAITHLDEAGLRDSTTGMRLYAALASALLPTEGTSTRCRDCWQRVLDLARRFGDRDFEARALNGLATFSFIEGDFSASLDLARQFAEIGRVDDGSTSLLIGSALHSLGRLGESQLHLRQAIATARSADPITPARFGVDTGVAATGMLARLNWLLGRPEDARTLLRDALVTSRELGHANTRCCALEVGILLAIRLGDYDAAERRLAELRTVARDHGLLIWDGFATWFEGWLLSERGSPAAALVILQRAMAASTASRGRIRYNLLASNIAVALGRTGEAAEGLALIRSNLAEVRVERDGTNLFVPEHARIEAELMGLLDKNDPAAEARLREVIALTQAHGIVAYELRAVTTLAQLCERQGRIEAARPLLAAVCAKYRPEDVTSDLLAARALLG